MPPSDEQCVRFCLDGSPGAYRHLIERHQTPLMRCLCARLGNVDEAEEVAQEAFVRAYFTLGKLRNPAVFFSWLFGIADRVVKETQRAANRSRTVNWKEAGLAEPAAKQPPDSETCVAEAVAMLPDIYREVVVLRFYGGQSCVEIGRDLSVPLGTVTKRLSRAYALLREALSMNTSNRD